jgi:putative acetyltransferase
MELVIVIRDETPEDVGAISEVTATAFETLEISDHTEQFMIVALRAAQALSVSLVAERDGQVVGHVAFSPVTISDGTPAWYILGPISVLPEHQCKGIGKALTREGLSRLEDIDARGCCVVGHPEYYGRFGFINPSGLGHEGVPPEAFFSLAFDGHTPQGTVELHAAFGADGRHDGAGAPRRTER